MSTSSEQDPLATAKIISEKYGQIGKCCEIISSIASPDDELGFFMRNGGWKTYASTIKAAGIDINDVYAYINQLAEAKKAQLENELADMKVV